MDPATRGAMERSPGRAAPAAGSEDAEEVGKVVGSATAAAAGAAAMGMGKERMARMGTRRHGGGILERHR